MIRGAIAAVSFAWCALAAIATTAAAQDAAPAATETGTETEAAADTDAVAQEQTGGEAVVLDLSEKLIAITSNFTGARLLLFGNVEAPDTVTPALQRDVVAVVRGPYEPLIIRHKQRMGGVWVNTDAEEVPAAPGFYHVSSTRPLADIAAPEVFAEAQIGLAVLDFDAERDSAIPLPADYKQAVLRAKTREELYAEAPGAITFVGASLFRAEIALPANVPVGSYIATVYLLRDGAIAGQRSINLIINKSGLDRFLYNFAQKTPFFYGVAAVLMALLAGWIAGTVFRER